METYVVRVYRSLEENGHEILGMVEIVEKSENRPFTSLKELMGIIAPHRRRREALWPGAGSGSLSG
jgi:hypothetical protein